MGGGIIFIKVTMFFSDRLGSTGDWLYKGKKCDCGFATIWWKKNFNGEKLLAREFCVSTKGCELEEVKTYQESD